MPPRAFMPLCILSALLCAGCGRIGVDNLAEDPPAQAHPAERDSGEPDMLDAAVAEPSDAQGDVTDDAELADAFQADDTGSGADVPDAAIPDAAPPDAAPPDAAVADCQLTVSGSMMGYRTGEVAVLAGTHMFTLEQTGLCAGLAGCTSDLGADVTQASCSISTCQMWESVDIGGGFISLRNAQNGACLYVASTADGTNAITWECFDTDQVRWQVVCAGNNTWHLISKLTKKVFGGDGSSTPGAGIVQAAQSTSSQQRWRITSNPMAYDVVMASAETDTNALWRNTTVTPPGTWTQTSFDDSSWSIDPGAFGDTARGFTAQRTAWTSSDIWLRRQFSLNSLPARLSVKVFHDDAVEVFINGAAVATPTGWSHGYQTVDVPGSIMSSLLVGANSIAVHCHNASAPQFIDVGLVSYTWQ